jgi:hypothetical protein
MARAKLSGSLRAARDALPATTPYGRVGTLPDGADSPIAKGKAAFACRIYGAAPRAETQELRSDRTGPKICQLSRASG